MKNKFLIISILFFIIAFAACKEVETDPILSLNGPASISSPTNGQNIVLTEENIGETFGFAWEAADFGFASAATYDIFVDVAGNNFETEEKMGTANGTSLDVNHTKLNNFALDNGFESGDLATLEARVVATLTEEAVQTSNSVPFNITPFVPVGEEPEIVYPVLQVPGSYQGWAPENEETVIFSPEDNGVYEGYIYFPEAAALYKFTDGPGWEINWGDDDADGTLDSGGTDITQGDAGMYYLTADINALTHSSEKRDWGILGDATPTGWDADTDFGYNPETGNLSITLDMVAGPYKFRVNDDWAINLGDTGADGILEAGGDDLVLDEDGNYTIELILNNPVYTYTIVKN